MKFYKKLILTLSGAGMLTACASDESYQSVVIAKTSDQIFLDTDNDGLADERFDFNYMVQYGALYDYIMVGDTVVWRPGNALTGQYHPTNIKTVNGHSQDKISKLVKVRQSHNGKIR